MRVIKILFFAFGVFFGNIGDTTNSRAFCTSSGEADDWLNFLDVNDEIQESNSPESVLSTTENQPPEIDIEKERMRPENEKLQRISDIKSQFYQHSEVLMRSSLPNNFAAYMSDSFFLSTDEIRDDLQEKKIPKYFGVIRKYFT